MIDDSASRRKDAWLPEQDQALIDLRADQFPWKNIAERVGRTVEACCGRYRVLLPEENRARFRTSKRWSAEDEATLHALVAQKKSPGEIAKEMGRPAHSIYNKIEYTRKIGRTAHFEPISRVTVPAACEADRVRRMSAERDLTSVLMGDPARGQSAFDKMRRSQQRAVA